MTSNRRFTPTPLALAGALALLASLATSPASALARSGDGDGPRTGLVFTSSNAPAGNELLVYARQRDGTLAPFAQLATGGTGTGAGLGSQGAVTLSGDARFVFVVNALSNTLSTFDLRGHAPHLVSTVASGGVHPISVTEHDGTVFVVNDGGDGNVAGFRNHGGTLAPIAGSVRGLSVAGGAGPGQVGLNAAGDTLVVTEKTTSRLTSYRVGDDGSLGLPIVTASSGQTPFGFAFDRRNHLIVTEAVGGTAGASTTSSYRFAPADPAQPVIASASVPDTQTAACWVALSSDGRHAYVTNTGSSSVSSYRVARDGRIALTGAVAGGTGAGSVATDVAVSTDGRHLVVRNGGTFTVSSFRIAIDGHLTPENVLAGLPTTAVGIAAN
jgi:hypothetical protein